MKNILIIICLFCSGILFAQNNNNLAHKLQEQTEGEGTITIYDEEGIEELIDIQVEVNERIGGVEGWRIQLYSGSGPVGKRNGLKVKSKFLNSFPHNEVDLSFTSPFWRVRVGNYRHKHEALPLLTEVRELFPNCYIVKDGNVKMSKF
ncbi:SPOR domain-containing protein [Carboxylicivirga sp. M1479]|uniref:SPOR domain-containing protein n=1 Tax=Carboxylicivirga sp. M1479 TaxID=2594476 RepID=UPI00117889C9|nr:SPOR domain-containing protein [Carboxylicivirga sp. M1479]TRX71816.1 SPOR domain-containing protein [Carboxylicivirga sp. M1479]